MTGELNAEGFDFEGVERTIGYVFQNKQLLLTACTHSSYAEHYKTESNENLEFFGDAVLEMIVSEKLYTELYKSKEQRGESGARSDEGKLTKRRANTVKDAALKEVVEKSELDKYLRFFGKKENNLGDKPIPSLFEALTAAIYLDGGYERAKEFVLDMLGGFSFFGEDFANANYKGKVKEFLEKQGKPVPEYRVLEKRGKDHDPTFIVEASADGVTVSGKGKNKKDAEQEAAKKLLNELSKGTNE
jgi:ribonuclease-3